MRRRFCTADNFLIDFDLPITCILQRRSRQNKEHVSFLVALGRNGATIYAMQPRFSRFVLAMRYGTILLIGIGIGWSIDRAFQAHSTAAETTTIIREPEGKYRFINPLIGFNLGEKEAFTEYAHLERTLREKIALLKTDRKIYSASVYFRDMESGHWTGVNEEELYSPASLYKVGLMIAVFKKSENDPKFLDKEIVFSGTRNSEKPDYPPMEVGKAYSVHELVDRLITISDNDAKDLLCDKVGIEAVSSVFADLRLDEPALSETSDSMSARTYSRFFRALYNATYLSRTMSEYALGLLSRVEFKSGIINGLPPEARTLTVAHKFGYRVFTDPLDAVTEELHDCGIVYIPNRPYFICIMTKGFEQTDLFDAIQALSQIAYGEAVRQEK